MNSDSQIKVDQHIILHFGYNHTELKHLLHEIVQYLNDYIY